MNQEIIARLNARLRRKGSAFTVPGSLPVLCFGDLFSARIVTVGINPSRQEYLNRNGLELDGPKRRFETLSSLRCVDRMSLTDEQCGRAVATMRGYFDVDKPVYAWFAGLGRVVEGFGFSFRERTAAHLDLVQESTNPVWSKIPARGKSEAALLDSDLPFLRWQLESFDLTAVICTSSTVMERVVHLTKAEWKEEDTFDGRHWRVAVASIRGRSVAIAGWNIPLSRAPGLKCEQQVELGRLLRDRVSAAGVIIPAPKTLPPGDPAPAGRRQAMGKDKDPLLASRLAGIAAFLPRFEKCGFRFGHWVEPKSENRGESVMPFYCLSKNASAFVQAAYDLGWVRGDIDWSQWMQTSEAARLRDEEAALAVATHRQLVHLLTTLIRQDRFCEGSLAGAFESGLLTRIIRRAAVLAESAEE